MRHPFTAVAAVLLTGLTIGCQRESTRRVAEGRTTFKWDEQEGVTTRRRPVRPWTTAKARMTAKTPVPIGPGSMDQVAKLVNDNRAQAKLPALSLNPTLNRVVQEFAVLLAKEKNVAAVPGGKTLFDRVKEAGYAFQSIGSSGHVIRETATPDAVNRVLKQPQVAAELAKADYTDLAIGIGPGTDGNNYIVIVYATAMKK